NAKSQPEAHRPGRRWRGLTDPSSGDGSGENLVIKRARVGVVLGWMTEQKVLSATPLGSIEARGNGGRRPVGLGQLSFRCAGTNAGTNS
ncbi:hypothetical protein ACLOJK_003379, partial [Asimina triloba]